MFVTTTTLGYIPALRKDAEKQILLARLADDCRFFPFAFCIMEHPIHMVIRAPAAMTMS